MIEAKDLELLNRICKELEAQGYTKPRVSIFGATSQESSVNLAFSKIASQMQEGDS